MSGGVCWRCNASYNDTLISCPHCDAERKSTVGKDSLVFESGALIDLLSKNQDPAFRELARYVRAGVDYELSLYFAADLVRSASGTEPSPPKAPP